MTATDHAPALLVRPAAAHVVHRVLHLGRALFTPGVGWRVPALENLAARVRDAAAADEGNWSTRWETAVRGGDDAEVQLAAEALYVHVLFPSDLRPATKRALVHGTLSWMADPPAVPPLLSSALDGGVAASGIAFTRRRLSQVVFLLTAAARWRISSAPTRREALADPWAFKDWLWQIPPDGGHAQREVLLHLVHPDTFEPIVSRRVKREIVAGFGIVPEDGDVDRALQRLRRDLTPAHGAGFAFVDQPVAKAWRSLG